MPGTRSTTKSDLESESDSIDNLKLPQIIPLEKRRPMNPFELAKKFGKKITLPKPKKKSVTQDSDCTWSSLDVSLSSIPQVPKNPIYERNQDRPNVPIDLKKHGRKISKPRDSIIGFSSQPEFSTRSTTPQRRPQRGSKTTPTLNNPLPRSSKSPLKLVASPLLSLSSNQPEVSSFRVSEDAHSTPINENAPLSYLAPLITPIEGIRKKNVFDTVKRHRKITPETEKLHPMTTTSTPCLPMPITTEVSAPSEVDEDNTNEASGWNFKRNAGKSEVAIATTASSCNSNGHASTNDLTKTSESKPSRSEYLGDCSNNNRTGANSLSCVSIPKPKEGSSIVDHTRRSITRVKEPEGLPKGLSVHEDLIFTEDESSSKNIDSSNRESSLQSRSRTSDESMAPNSSSSLITRRNSMESTTPKSHSFSKPQNLSRVLTQNELNSNGKPSDMMANVETQEKTSTSLVENLPPMPDSKQNGMENANELEIDCSASTDDESDAAENEVSSKLQVSKSSSKNASQLSQGNKDDNNVMTEPAAERKPGKKSKSSASESESDSAAESTSQRSNSRKSVNPNKTNSFKKPSTPVKQKQVDNFFDNSDASSVSSKKANKPSSQIPIPKPRTRLTKPASPPATIAEKDHIEASNREIAGEMGKTRATSACKFKNISVHNEDDGEGDLVTDSASGSKKGKNLQPDASENEFEKSSNKNSGFKKPQTPVKRRQMDDFFENSDESVASNHSKKLISQSQVPNARNELKKPPSPLITPAEEKELFDTANKEIAKGIGKTRSSSRARSSENRKSESETETISPVSSTLSNHEPKSTEPSKKPRSKKSSSSEDLFEESEDNNGSTIRPEDVVLKSRTRSSSRKNNSLDKNNLNSDTKKSKTISPTKSKKQPKKLSSKAEHIISGEEIVPPTTSDTSESSLTPKHDKKRITRAQKSKRPEKNDSDAETVPPKKSKDGPTLSKKSPVPPTKSINANKAAPPPNDYEESSDSDLEIGTQAPKKSVSKKKQDPVNKPKSTPQNQFKKPRSSGSKEVVNDSDISMDESLEAAIEPVIEKTVRSKKYKTRKLSQPAIQRLRKHINSMMSSPEPTPPPFQSGSQPTRVRKRASYMSTNNNTMNSLGVSAMEVYGGVLSQTYSNVTSQLSQRSESTIQSSSQPLTYGKKQQKQDNTEKLDKFNQLKSTNEWVKETIVVQQLTDEPIAGPSWITYIPPSAERPLSTAAVLEEENEDEEEELEKIPKDSKKKIAEVSKKKVKEGAKKKRNEAPKGKETKRKGGKGKRITEEFKKTTRTRAAKNVDISDSEFSKIKDELEEVFTPSPKKVGNSNTKVTKERRGSEHLAIISSQEGDNLVRKGGKGKKDSKPKANLKLPKRRIASQNVFTESDDNADEENIGVEMGDNVSPDVNDLSAETEIESLQDNEKFGNAKTKGKLKNKGKKARENATTTSTKSPPASRKRKSDEKAELPIARKLKRTSSPRSTPFVPEMDHEFAVPAIPPRRNSSESETDFADASIISSQLAETRVPRTRKRRPSFAIKSSKKENKNPITAGPSRRPKRNPGQVVSSPIREESEATARKKQIRTGKSKPVQTLPKPNPQKRKKREPSFYLPSNIASNKNLISEELIREKIHEWSGGRAVSEEDVKEFTRMMNEELEEHMDWLCNHCNLNLGMFTYRELDEYFRREKIIPKKCGSNFLALQMISAFSDEELERAEGILYPRKNRDNTTSFCTSYRF